MKREIFVFDLLDNEGLHGLVLLGVGEGDELLLVQPTVSATIRGQEQVSGNKKCFTQSINYPIGLYIQTQSTYIYRVPECMSPRWNWDSPTPSLASERAPPPLTKGGGGHTRLQVGVEGVPIPTTGEKA